MGQALIPGKDLKANGYLGKPSEEFYIGQVLQVRCINCKPKNRRMLCSLNLNVTNYNDDYQDVIRKRNTSSFWCKIVEKNVDHFIVRKLMNYDENKSDDDEADSNSDSDVEMK